jgi:hypothetical protein
MLFVIIVINLMFTIDFEAYSNSQNISIPRKGQWIGLNILFLILEYTTIYCYLLICMSLKHRPSLKKKIDWVKTMWWEELLHQRNRKFHENGWKRKYKIRRFKIYILHPNIYEVSSSSNLEESGIRIHFADDLVVVQ